MNLPELWAEIEHDQEERESELRFFQNLLIKIPQEKTEDRDRFRKALILLLYSHFEGFCKFTLTLYLRTINSQNITCKEAHPAIAAASLKSVLAALRDPSSKCKEFARALPDDAKLHLFAREQEFMQRVQEFYSKPVSIPDNAIDLESNLKPIVLRKNLFRLGFRHDEFQDLEGTIDHLLNIRNQIAHGSSSKRISEKMYDEIERAVRRISNELKRKIMEALETSYFRSNPS